MSLREYLTDLTREFRRYIKERLEENAQEIKSAVSIILWGVSLLLGTFLLINNGNPIYAFFYVIAYILITLTISRLWRDCILQNRVTSVCGLHDRKFSTQTKLDYGRTRQSHCLQK